MATDHLKQATQDAADAVTDVVDSAKDAVVDAKDAVMSTTADAVEHSRSIETVQASLEARADEREQAARRAEH